MSTTVVYGRRAADLLVLDADGHVDGYQIMVPPAHLHLTTTEAVGDVGVFLSRAGVLELREVIDRWLDRQKHDAEEET